MSNIVYSEKGKFWAVVDGQRTGFDTLQDAIDFLGKCCGINCCEKAIRLPDTVTKDRHTIFFENGSLKTKNETTGVVRIILA